MATRGSSKCKELLVAAIDFGTTYSGYAFSFITQYNKSPGEISCNKAWTSGTEKLLSLKTPTVLLLHWNETDQQFTREDFVFNAENKYQTLVDDGREDNYYLLRHFKMELHNRTASSGLTRESTLQIGNDKSIKLSKAISMAIEFLKEHLLMTLNDRQDNVSVNDIRWMLTVPAIWTDAGKQMMTEAANEAGIPENKLTLVLEPEAASLYCMHLPSNTSENDMKLQEGTRFIVIDAGGGTVDITVHQIYKGGGLLELHAPTGGPWGGTMVDFAFTRFLTELFGANIMHQFSEECQEDYMELCRSFECKKRIAGNNNEMVTFKLPYQLIQTFKTTNKRENIFEDTKYNGSVKLSRDKLRINSEVIKGLFRESVDNILVHAEELVCVYDISIIILVGGYGESQFIKHALRSKFDDKKVIIPEDAGLAVVKGAVMFGHDPGAVISRVAPFTYGVKINDAFDAKKHPADKKVINEGRIRCLDVFSIYITKGEDLKWGVPHSPQSYRPTKSDQTSVEFAVYISTATNPDFVTDESCTRVGVLNVPLASMEGGYKRYIDVSFTFDGVIKVTGVEKATNNEVSISIDFLSKQNI